MVKTTFIHGLAMAIAGAVLNLALYLLGFHDDPSQLGTGQLIGSLGGVGISITGLILVMKARRAQKAVDEGFSYGAALGTGTVTSLWSAILGTAFHLLYLTVINPGFTDAVVAGQIAKMEAQGVPPSQIDQAEGMIRLFSGPPMQAVFVFVGGMFFGFILSLIIAAFLKQAPTESFEEVEGNPPPLING